MPIAYKPVSQKVLIEGAIDERNRLHDERVRKDNEAKALRESQERKASTVLEARLSAQQKRDKYAGFVEEARATLVETVLFTVLSKAMRKVAESRNMNYSKCFSESTMHALAYEFVHEDSSMAVLNKLKSSRSTTYSNEMGEIVTKYFNAIMEDVVPTDDSTFTITSSQLKKFRDEIDNADTDACCDDIAGRVAKSIEIFITNNARDKNRIADILTATKEKVDSITGDGDEIDAVKESYARIGRREVTKIREGKKDLFTEMVTTMAEGVINTPELQYEFMEDGHIDVHKIVNKMSLMYGFLETVNVMRLVKIDDAYLKNILESMKKY